MPLGEPMTAPADPDLAPVAGGATPGSATDDDAITGSVKWFDVKKGFGFIVGPDGQDVFVHFSTIRCDGFRTLKDGERVSYELHRGDKGYHAKNVCRLDADDKPADKDGGKAGNAKAVARAIRSQTDDAEIPNIAADRPRRRPALDGYVG